MSSPEEKINNLIDRIKQDPAPKNLAMSHQGSQPRAFSTPRNNGDVPTARPRLDLNSGGANRRPRDLSFLTRNNDNSETDQRLKEIMKISGELTINNIKYKTDIADMIPLEALGSGTCGHVIKMQHKPSNEIIAVKQMRRSGNIEENNRIIMDIEVVLKSHGCRYIVECLGCFITDGEVWICMELMTTCFDKLLKRLGTPIPEDILGKVTVAIVEALSYLKDTHDVIHRDVKPSNILVDTKGKGFIKLCDFGISGRLVDSMAKTRSAGCAAYLAPERIDPDPNNQKYDIRADVWSLGITLVELATGVFPYPDCKTDFEVLTKVIAQEPPSLPDTFSVEFRDFVKRCLIKDQRRRPKYQELKHLPFIKKYQTKDVNVGEWVLNALKKADGGDAVACDTSPRSNVAQSAFRRIFNTSSHPKQSSDVISTTPIQSQSQIVNGNNPNCQYKPLKPPELNSKSLEEHQNVSFKLLPPPSTMQRGSGHVSRLSTFQQQATSNCISNQHQRNDSNLNQSTVKSTTTTANNETPPNTFPPSSGFVSTNNQFKCSPLQAYQKHLAATRKEYDCGGQVELHHQQQQQHYQNRILSPFQQRRVASETRWRSPSASPLPLRSQFQHQNSQEQQQQQYNCGNTSPIILQRFYHQQKQQQLAKEAEESGKKRFASYIKLQLSGDRSGRSSRHQSPEPPPRINRGLSCGENNQSPLAMHRTFFDGSGNNVPCSPSLSRRYVSPSPPVPPPRRLSESTSVPGSPQHFRARFHYTPEPQRRLFQNNDVS